MKKHTAITVTRIFNDFVEAEWEKRKENPEWKGIHSKGGFVERLVYERIATLQQREDQETGRQKVRAH